MVANGRDSKGLSKVIDLNSTNKCSPLPNYPIRVFQASGATLNDSPVICGGRDEMKDYRNECYIYNVTLNQWKLLARMNTERSKPRFVVVENALWIVGGFNNYNSNLKNTEC